MTALTVIRKLPTPWSVGGEKATDIELREPLLKDIIEAEKESNPATGPNAYSAALAAATMVRAGSYTGPFAAAQFLKMNSRSWYVVREAISEAEMLGEAEPADPTPRR